MTPKPQTFTADLANLPKPLQRLTTLPRWVVWRWELRRRKNGARWTKPPYRCDNPQITAKSNEPGTWNSHTVGVAAIKAGQADGIGFMLKDSEIGAADLDHVRDIQTGDLLGWAKRMSIEAERRGLYIEVTVSGCGLRFIGLS